MVWIERKKRNSVPRQFNDKLLQTAIHGYAGVVVQMVKMYQSWLKSSRRQPFLPPTEVSDRYEVVSPFLLFVLILESL